MADPRKVPDLKTDLQLGDAALETIRHAALVHEREPLIAQQAANLAAKVDRIVILMLENRSYDHMLGWVGPGGGGLTGNEFCPLVAPKMGAPPVAPPVDRQAPGRPFVTGETRLPISPSHSGRATLREINGGNMQGFLEEFGKERAVEIRLRGEIGGTDGQVMPMATYSAESLAAYAHLVRHEITCSSWHASVPAGTWPNRMYLYSGSCGGRLGNGNVVIRDKVFDTFMPKYLIVDRLDQAASPVTWSVYTHNITWMRLYPDRQKGFAKNTKPFRQLKKDCEKGGGSLAQVVFVDPRHEVDVPGSGHRTRNDDLAPANLVDGQQLVADVYRALAELPLAERQRTMLVVTYDEHGGFYDHVSPPLTIGKNVDEDEDFEKDGVRVPAFERYGVRVPAFVCSAFAPAGTFSNLLFDHASLHATLHRRFLPGVRFPSRRVEVANTLGALLTRDVPRAPFPIDDLPTDFGIGRGARQEERADRREDRRDDRAERRDDRQDNRAERREDRQDHRETRRDDRQDDRAERREDRQDDRAVRREDDDGLAEWIRSLGEPDGA